MNLSSSRRARQVYLNNQKFFFLVVCCFLSPPEDINAQEKILAVELAWEHHMNEHILSCCSLDCCRNLSKVTFSASETATKLSHDEQKGAF